MNRLSACLITLNEERNLPRALQSLDGVADEIVVVDSGSTDGTPRIAQEHGALFFARAWTNYSDQKNFAAERASHPWILSLDADEELSAELRNSLLEWKKGEPKFPVYEFARRTSYLGAWINHSGWYPNFQRRLYRRDLASFSGIVHEGLRFEGKAGRLSGNLFHYTVESFAEHEEKVERYAALAAQQMYAAGRRNWRGGKWFAVPWTWFQNFVLRGAILDGSRGAKIARMAARSVRRRYEKLGELVEAERRSAAKKT